MTASRALFSSVALLVSLVGCGQPSVRVDPAAAVTGGLGGDEGGPGSVAATFGQSQVIVRAELSSVVDEVRIYGSGGDDPSTTWWEEVGLVFTPVETLKGSLPPAG